LKHSFTISISSVEIQGKRVKYNTDVEDVSNIYEGGQYRMEKKLKGSNTHDLKTNSTWFGGQDLPEFKKKNNNNWKLDKTGKEYDHNHKFGLASMS